MRAVFAEDDGASSIQDGGSEGAGHYQCDYKRAKRFTKLMRVLFGRRGLAAGNALRLQAVGLMLCLLGVSIGCYIGEQAACATLLPPLTHLIRARQPGHAGVRICRQC